MTKEYFFKDAKWVGAPQRDYNTFSILKGTFRGKRGATVTLRALGLGFFKCFVNGTLVNPDTFLPLSSDFEDTCDPRGEVLAGHRLYVPTFDITSLVREGENEIALHFGGGWYTFRGRPFGLPKAIYRVTVATEEGCEDFVSDGNCRILESFVSDYDFVKYETHDHTRKTNETAAVLTEEPGTEYMETDCPPDALIRIHTPTPLPRGGGRRVYDAGRNLTGTPVLRITATKGETVRVRFSEDLDGEGLPDSRHAHGQEFTVISDGEERIDEALFTWYCFRYFEIEGGAEPLSVKEIHAKVPVTSTFESDDPVLNWTYRTFLHTMLCNLHTGHPSDCPHLERRGYTGDGQLTTHAVLTTLGAEALYRKWLGDILDCQDTLSGHVQYTAPYIRSGGGPGGWGCAVVEVPWQLYRHTGDVSVLVSAYGAMRRYIDYLESHSEFGLVTRDKEGEWCLGDWCGPNILYPDRDITSHNQQVILPAPFVNTYFMIKSLSTMCDIAALIGKEEDVGEYREKIETRKNAVRAAYFNTFDGNFVMNVQGANAFAADLGLGNERTYPNLVSYYTKLGHLDTGIFATDVVLRLLFERGDGDLALRLLTAEGPQGYAHWKEAGATTLHEYWDSNRSRSHCHPMFGAPVAYFFEYLLGIGQREGTAGYTDVIIRPVLCEGLSRISGSIQTPRGALLVAYEKAEGEIRFRITVPEGVRAVLCLGEGEHPLSEGDNGIALPLVSPK